ncbi:MAG: hypothetical protein BWY06_02965 [Candidatus Latescibacteria bacterium ADurb.Bin168]|nr:MAG: hypothetical protein BWY06_02965 [Candidatus Latescibacteria bacterium ADurb.Bin168]
MTIDELKKTRWWKRWVKDVGCEPVEEEIEAALNPKNTFRIAYNPFGLPVHRWQIIWNEANTTHFFLMDEYDSKRNALRACERMGWKVVE